MLHAKDVFNAIIVLPPAKRNAIWNILQCGDDPECAEFFCYAVKGLKYRYDYDTALEFYLELLDENIRGEHWDEPVPEPWLAKQRLIASFHAVQQDMLHIGWDGDYSQEPTVFHLPCPESESLELGFIWKQHRNGLTFIASPMPLPWLGEARVKKGDKR